MTKTSKNPNNSKSIISYTKESISKPVFIKSKIFHFPFLIAFFLSVGIVISIGVTGLNAQERQDISEYEKFLLKSLRIVDSMARKAEHFNAEDELEKAIFFAEYFQRGTSISDFEITNLNQIARELSRDERAFALEQNKLLKFRRFTREEFEQLMPQELRALIRERKRKVRENRKTLQALKARREAIHMNYLNRIHQTISPKTLTELWNFINSEVTILNIDSGDVPDTNSSASLNFIPTSFDPSAPLLSSGSSVQVWAIPHIYYDQSKQEIEGIAETWGFCTEYESGGGGGGGGGGGPFFSRISNRLLEGSGYSVPCDYIYAEAKLFNPSNVQIGIKDQYMYGALDDAVEASVKKPVTESGNYCVKGTHKAKYGSLINTHYPTQKCVQVQVPEIGSVEFVDVNEIGGPVDDHPAINGLNTSNKGKRIYPDKESPTDETDRTKVQIKATVTPATQGINIYFKSFDMDDPSSNTAPLDNESLAQDNRGSVNNKKEGELNNGSGGCGSNCATTDSSGVATIELTVTKQPGDNFAVVASKDSNQLGGVTVSGLNLMKGGTSVQTTQTSPTNPLIRTELLTVWRRLHIEYDRMGIISGNVLVGSFSGAQTIGTSTTTLTVNTSPELQLNRYENGRMVVVNSGGNISFSVIDFSTQPSGAPNANTSTTVRVTNTTGSPLSVVNGQSFYLYDDDDFNSDDSSALNGDTGDIVPFFQQHYMKDNDVIPTSTTSTNSNVFAKAYIRPTYGGLSGSLENVPITLNIAADNQQSINNEFDFDNDNLEANTDFWTIYLLSGYQYVIAEDGDPLTESTTYGTADSTSGNNDGEGAIIYYSAHSPQDCSSVTNLACLVDVTFVHEVGHLFSADHGQGGLMDDISINFSEHSLNAIRSVTHP